MKKVIALILILSMCVCFCSCGTSEKEKQEILTAIKTAYDGIVTVSEDEKTLVSIVKSGTEITVTEIVEQDDGIYAECEIKNYDIDTVLTKYLTENSEKEIKNENFLNDVEKVLQETEKTSTQVQIAVEKNDKGEWTAKITEEQLDIFLGGYITFMQHYIESLRGEQVS